MKRQKVTSIRDIGDLEFDDVLESDDVEGMASFQTAQSQQAPQPSGAAADSGAPSHPREVRQPPTYYETRAPQPLSASSLPQYHNIVNILDRIHPVERAAIMLKYAGTDAVIRKLTVNEIIDYLQHYNIPSDILNVIKIWAEIKEHGK